MKEGLTMRQAGRRWRNALPFLCFFCLALTAAMALYTWKYEPDRYCAAYTFYALPPGTTSDTDAVQRARMLARDCDALLATPAFQRQVLAACPSDGQTRLTAVGKDGAHMIQVLAVGVEPQMVVRLANGAGRELLIQAQSVLGATEGKEIAPATLPQAPFAPNRPLKTLWMLLVSFAGLSLLGMLFGSSHTPIKWKPGWVGQTALPCLGGVVAMDPLLRTYERHKRRDAPAVYHQASPTARENMREIALALRNELPRSGGSLTVAGVGQESDSPTFSLLLASELAMEGFDVLLMEMDAFAPRLRTLVDMTGRLDIQDCLSNESALSGALLSTAIPRLCFMDVCHAPGFVTSLAATDAFATFINDALHAFRYVILNAPPADSRCDAAMLGAVTNATLLTARDGKLVPPALDAQTQRLLRTTKRLIGYVLVGVPQRRFARAANDQPTIKAQTL